MEINGFPREGCHLYAGWVCFVRILGMGGWKSKNNPSAALFDPSIIDRGIDGESIDRLLGCCAV